MAGTKAGREDRIELRTTKEESGSWTSLVSASVSSKGVRFCRCRFVLDGGQPQAVLLGQMLPGLHRDGEVLGQFAALIQKIQSTITPLAAESP